MNPTETRSGDFSLPRDSRKGSGSLRISFRTSPLLSWLSTGSNPKFGRFVTFCRSSPSIAWEPSRQQSTVKASVPVGAVDKRLLVLPVAEQVHELLAALSLNKSLLAEVLGVARQTLYEWLDGNEPHRANVERIELFLRCLAEVGVSSTAPLNARFVRQPLVLAVLCDATADKEAIVSVLHQARQLSQQAADEQRRRQDRLRVLGYEEPGEDENRQRLARNVALLDWPKP